MKLFMLSFFVLTLFIGTNTFAQEANWVPIELNTSKIFKQGMKMYVDVSKVSKFKGTDFYTWVLEEHNPPINLESVRGDIYKTKTYYLFNKELKRYSILEVIYYDEKDNVLNSFSYKHNSDITEYKYAFPLNEGSVMEKVYNKCLQFM